MKFVKGDKPGWSALFSDDEIYRFTIERRISDPVDGYERRLVVCALNPSSANSHKNDPTMHSITQFARLWHCSLVVVVNAYAWRATTPAEMFSRARVGADIAGGEENDEAIRCAFTMMKRDGGIALAAWGRWCTGLRARRVAELARSVGVELMCLGTNKDGSPKHPLYIPRSTVPQPWTAT